MTRIHPELLKRARQLRQDQTSAEQKLWLCLKACNCEGLKFRRQHPIGQFIADFYCAQSKLVIEIDGDSHALQIEYDRDRTAWLESQGYRVIRFTNPDVYSHVETVVDIIIRNCREFEIQKKN